MLFQKGYHICYCAKASICMVALTTMQHGEGTKGSQGVPLTLQVKPLESLLLLQRSTLPPATQWLADCCYPEPDSQHCSWLSEVGSSRGGSAMAALATQAALLEGERAMPPQA